MADSNFFQNGSHGVDADAAGDDDDDAGFVEATYLTDAAVANRRVSIR